MRSVSAVLKHGAELQRVSKRRITYKISNREKYINGSMDISF